MSISAMFGDETKYGKDNNSQRKKKQMRCHSTTHCVREKPIGKMMKIINSMLKRIVHEV